MLFERIRRTQKPIFVFLAVTFAMGFVLLGVGQGAGSINALDFLTGGTSSSDPTSSLKDQVTKNPKDAAAWQPARRPPTRARARTTMRSAPTSRT